MHSTTLSHDNIKLWLTSADAIGYRLIIIIIIKL